MRLRYALPIVFGVLYASLVRAEPAPSERMSRELLTHDSVLIDSSAATIWPYILDPNSWKKGDRNEHLSGAPGQLGEILVAKDGGAAAEPDFYLQNVELVPNKRRTIKLYASANGPLIGYASWVLHEENGKTRVTYHVFTENLLSPKEVKGLTAKQLAEAQRQFTNENETRFIAELAGLKILIETQEAKGK